MNKKNKRIKDEGIFSNTNKIRKTYLTLLSILILVSFILAIFIYNPEIRNNLSLSGRAVLFPLKGLDNNLLTKVDYPIEQAPLIPYCGNGIIEEKEECDCGKPWDCTDNSGDELGVFGDGIEMCAKYSEKFNFGDLTCDLEDCYINSEDCVYEEPNITPIEKPPETEMPTLIVEKAENCNLNGECEYILGESYGVCDDCPFKLKTEHPYLILNNQEITDLVQNKENNPIWTYYKQNYERSYFFTNSSWSKGGNLSHINYSYVFLDRVEGNYSIKVKSTGVNPENNQVFSYLKHFNNQHDYKIRFSVRADSTHTVRVGFHMLNEGYQWLTWKILDVETTNQWQTHEFTVLHTDIPIGATRSMIGLIPALSDYDGETFFDNISVVDQTTQEEEMANGGFEKNYELPKSFLDQLHLGWSVNPQTKYFIMYYTMDGKSDEHKFNHNLNLVVNELLSIPYTYIESENYPDLYARNKYEILGYIYDFFYNDLTDEQKSQIRYHIVDLLRFMDTEYWTSSYKFLTYPNSYISAGHHVHARVSAFAPLLAIYGECELGMNCTVMSKQLFEGYENFTIPYSDYVMDNGGYYLGWTYYSYSYFFQYDLWENANDDTERSWQRTWQQKMAMPFIYGLQFEPFLNSSFGEYPTFSDSYFRRDNLEFSAEFPIFLKNFDNPSLKWFIDNYALNNLDKYNTDYLFYYLLYYEKYKNKASAPFSELPLSRYIGNSGYVMMKDKWDLNDATTMVFKSTRMYTYGHQHLDQNSFTLFYKSPLLVDSGEYAACGSSDPHWANYSERTIAHNTLIVYDPAETFGQGLGNDGGQKHMIQYPNLTQVQNENYIDGIRRYKDYPDFSFTEGDATKAYSNKINNYTRSILFLNNLTYWRYPIIIMKDFVNTSNPSYKKSLLYHTITRPIVQNNVIKLVGNDTVGGYNSSLTINFFSNAPLDYSIIGGTGKEYFVNGLNPLPMCGSRNFRPEAGNWRVEVSELGTVNNWTTYSILLPADNNETISNNFVVNSDTSFIIGNYTLVAFLNNSNKITFTYSKNSDFNEVFIVSDTPRKGYYVIKRGTPQGMEVEIGKTQMSVHITDDEGVLHIKKIDTYCGNGICEVGENRFSCNADCPFGYDPKFIKTFQVYYGGGPHLIPGDDILLARYDLLDIDRMRFGSINGNTWQAIKAINPNIKIFLYVSGARTANFQDSYWTIYLNTIARFNDSRGHYMGNINIDNNEFLLKNSSNGLIYSTAYSIPEENKYNYFLDFGNRQVVEYWTEAVKTDILDTLYAADGVFIDDCSTLDLFVDFSSRPVLYPTTTSWSNAMNNHVEDISDYLRSKGSSQWVNRGHTRYGAGVDAWSDLDNSGKAPEYLMEEGAFVVKWTSEGYHAQFLPEQEWKRQIDMMMMLNNSAITTVSHTKLIEGQTGIDNYGKQFTFYDAFYFALGSFILGMNDEKDNAYFGYFPTQGFSSLLWYDEYDLINLGNSRGQYRINQYNGNNIYWREFDDGYVFVNPTLNDISGITLPIPAKQLNHSNINDIGNIAPIGEFSLASHRAAIFLKVPLDESGAEVISLDPLARSVEFDLNTMFDQGVAENVEVSNGDLVLTQSSPGDYNPTGSWVSPILDTQNDIVFWDWAYGKADFDGMQENLMPNADFENVSCRYPGNNQPYACGMYYSYNVIPPYVDSTNKSSGEYSLRMVRNNSLKIDSTWLHQNAYVTPSDYYTVDPIKELHTVFDLKIDNDGSQVELWYTLTNETPGTYFYHGALWNYDNPIKDFEEQYLIVNFSNLNNAKNTTRARFMFFQYYQNDDYNTTIWVDNVRVFQDSPISYKARTSTNGVDWTEWSEPRYLVSKRSSPGGQPDRYIQFKFILWSNDTLKTPKLEYFKLDYSKAFEFNIPWDYKTSSIFDPVIEPAGTHGYVVKNSEGNLEFSNDGTHARFWAMQVNDYAEEYFGTNQDLDKMCQKIRQMGFNMIKVTPPLYSTEISRWDKFDYMLKSCKDQGIYVYIQLNGVPPYTICQMIDNNNNFYIHFQDIMGHISSQTGIAYKDDPQFVFLQLLNENSLHSEWRGNSAYLQSCMPAIEMKWHSWLLSTYPTSAQMISSWSDGTAGRVLYEHEISTMSNYPNNVEIVNFTNWTEFTDKRFSDTSRFLSNVTGDFYSSVGGYLKNTMGAHGLIITNNHYYGQSELKERMRGDIIDQHSYFPYYREYVFGGEDVMQIPQTKAPFSNMISYTALDDIYGYPMSVSESNYFYPTLYNSELPIFTSVYMSYHDWDQWTYFKVHDHPPSDPTYRLVPEALNSWNDPSRMALMPAASMIFINSYVTPGSDTINLELTDNVTNDYKHNQRWYNWNIPGLSNEFYLTNRVQKTSFDAPIEKTAADYYSEYNLETPKSPYMTDTKELLLDSDIGYLAINASKAQGYTGFTTGNIIVLKDIELFMPSKGNNFSTIIFVPLDDKNISQSEDILLTAAGRTEANRTILKANKFGLDNDIYYWTNGLFGTEPVYVEGIGALINVNIPLSNLQVYIINSSGLRTGAMVPAARNGNGFTFEISDMYETLWYELVLTHPTTECIEDWVCTAWSGDNCGSRTCTDQNNCGTTVNKPSESETCSSSPMLVPLQKGGSTLMAPLYKGGSVVLSPIYKSSISFPLPQNVTTPCNDSFDNEGGIVNGCIDADDYRCAGIEINCDDGIDNDCDLKADCADSSCFTNIYCIQNNQINYSKPEQEQPKQILKEINLSLENNQSTQNKEDNKEIYSSNKQLPLTWLLGLLIIPLIVLIIIHNINLNNNQRKERINEEQIKIKQLKDYLWTAVSKGYDLEQIKERLVVIGWPKDIIKQEIETLKAEKGIVAQQRQEESPMMKV